VEQWPWREMCWRDGSFRRSLGMGGTSRVASDPYEGKPTYAVVRKFIETRGLGRRNCDVEEQQSTRDGRGWVSDGDEVGDLCGNAPGTETLYCLQWRMRASPDDKGPLIMGVVPWLVIGRDDHGRAGDGARKGSSTFDTSTRDRERSCRRRLAAATRRGCWERAS